MKLTTPTMATRASAGFSGTEYARWCCFGKCLRQRRAFSDRGLTFPLGACWMPTELQAWRDAARRLR